MTMINSKKIPIFDQYFVSTPTMTRVGKRKNLTLFGGYFVPTLAMTGLRVNFVERYSGTLYQFKSKKNKPPIRSKLGFLSGHM